MSGSPGCPAFCFMRSSLPLDIFGVPDLEGAAAASRRRFELRRRDPEFLEVLSSLQVFGVPFVGAASADSVAPAAPVEEVRGLRRCRRFLGLEAEYDEIVRVSRRRRLS